MRHISLLVVCLSVALLTPATSRAEDAAPAESTAESTTESGSAFRRSGGLLDRNPQERQHMLSFFAFPSWYYGFGVGTGARYTLPLVKNGFIPPVNDSFELEFGADAWYAGSFGYSYFAFGVPVEARWTFHFTDKFAAYAKAGLGFTLAFGDYVGVYSPVYFSSGAGVIWSITDAFALRAEAHTQGFRVGIGFSL